ncbi:MAG: aldolase/citrate lyase family protein [Planctomycetaceae bacterium]|nr:aldolase/citrate lyase family protein [Planctomycetaceae bacterium]
MTVYAFKSKLRDCQTATLVNIDYPSATLTNFVCRCGGIDAVMIDCEQGNPHFQDIEHCTMAARLNGVAAVVRVPSAEPWTIERHMMRDIDGIVVPRLDTAAQAAQAVEDIKYCAPKNFAEKSVIIQIESAQAVEELDGFLAVPDIDCFFLGAVDLAKSMGCGGDYSRPQVVDTLCRALARIRERGKCAGFLVSDRDVAVWRTRGAPMLYTHGHDFLRAGLCAGNESLGS